MARGMSATMPDTTTSSAIGFGPSNLALAIAVTEHNARAGRTTPSPRASSSASRASAGTAGMLLDDATMQVSFLKDLVTLRNPTSEFSFLSLPARPGPAGRLHQPQEPVPAARRVPRLPGVGRGEGRRPGHATATRSSRAGRSTPAATVVAADVVARHRRPAATVYRARNLVLGTGLRAAPAGRRDAVATGSGTTSDLLHRVERAGRPGAVAGSWWSAPGRAPPR